ncbi:hypothetical protein R1flu_014470 [Riccia fluitans]|uniref:Uncharacterized protein n=1 Tax=Riccia fluitans TaxID=41844 RepID=A0ABD1YJK7_9MARC
MQIRSILKNAHIEIKVVALRFKPEQLVIWKNNMDTILKWIGSLMISNLQILQLDSSMCDPNHIEMLRQENSQNLDTNQGSIALSMDAKAHADNRLGCSVADDRGLAHMDALRAFVSEGFDLNQEDDRIQRRQISSPIKKVRTKETSEGWWASHKPP